jgi:GNAT superfamily N-acetyltransferase
MMDTLAAPFERTLSLDDGLRVVLRGILPTDGRLLREGFGRMSMRSRLMRFFAPLHTLSDETVRYLTEVDGTNHVAIVAVSPPPAGRPSDRGFGVARFIRSSADPVRAELAITVTDDMQGRGLGRRLLEAVAIAARERGIEAFEMSVYWTNARVHAFLRRMGAVRRSIEGEVVEYLLATAPFIARLRGEAPGSAPPRRASRGL